MGTASEVVGTIFRPSFGAAGCCCGEPQGKSDAHVKPRPVILACFWAWSLLALGFGFRNDVPLAGTPLASYLAYWLLLRGRRRSGEVGSSESSFRRVTEVFRSLYC